MRTSPLKLRLLMGTGFWKTLVTNSFLVDTHHFDLQTWPTYIYDLRPDEFA